MHPSIEAARAVPLLVALCGTASADTPRSEAGSALLGPTSNPGLAGADQAPAALGAAGTSHAPVGASPRRSLLRRLAAASVGFARQGAGDLC